MNKVSISPKRNWQDFRQRVLLSEIKDDMVNHARRLCIGDGRLKLRGPPLVLRILGSEKRLCNGLTRRDMLHVGGLGLFGLGLDGLLRQASVKADTAYADRHFGRAKSCILLFLYGSPSQLETFDVKPDAPVEVRGELKWIPTRVAGFPTCELLPHTAGVIDRTTVVRSVTHPYPIHGVAYATTGVPTIDVPMELAPRDPRHWPFIGSVVDYLAEKESGGVPPPMPRNIALPWTFSSRRRGEVPRAGPYPAFLGSAYHPVWTEFIGQGTRPVQRTLAAETVEFYDPYMGIKPDGRFVIATGGGLADDLTLDRLHRRQSLLEQFDHARRTLDTAEPTLGLDRFRGMAYALLTSERLRTALDLAREPMTVRESYGMTLFGQASLVARRLVEAGTRLVTVFWDEYGLAGSGWDTHWDHYPRMKDELLPGFDRAFAGLVSDLDARGMLEETLVVCISEHGRTPKLNHAKGGGRDHWSQAYSAIFAGGGMARGRIVGRTDRIAGEVTDTPISPKDILATVYYLLGIDPETTIKDHLGRPIPISGDGRVRHELLA
jgi:hypothetical protein